MRLLLIEDNERLARNLAASLRDAGFSVDLAASADEAEAALATVGYDACILDLGLPDGDGMAVLARLRRRGDGVPVLICSARDAFEDRIAGLNAGSDDYVVKPFNTDELIARLRALLRRPGGALGVVLTAGNLAFDSVRREATVDGRPVALSRREMEVLEVLLRRVGRVVPKDALEQALYGFDEETTPNAIEVATHRLRKKLAAAGVSAQIHTMRGIGYVLRETPR
ncbi:MAG: response regulator transcription factor [Roseovarius sp.]